MSPDGVPDGLTQAVMVNRAPLRPLKHKEKDRQKKESEERLRERVRERTWENKQYEIIGLAVMHHSAAATLAAFI